MALMLGSILHLPKIVICCTFAFIVETIDKKNRGMIKKFFLSKLLYADIYTYHTNQSMTTHFMAEMYVYNENVKETQCLIIFLYICTAHVTFTCIIMQHAAMEDMYIKY